MVNARRIVSAGARLRGSLLPVAASLALAGALTAAARPVPAQASVTSIPGDLKGVSAVSASNVWAVGGDQAGTLTVHWNGKAWSQVKSPQLTDGILAGVSMVSASNGWAVGSYLNSSGNFAPLMLHWNGTKWVRVAAPAGTGPLYGVHMVSATDGWAAGEGWSASGDAVPRTLHWNGTKWANVAVPTTGIAGGQLYAVSATSASSVWAVGWYFGPATSGPSTLVLHWNGTAWTHVPTPPDPGPSTSEELHGVSATSASSAWAVGVYYPFTGPTKTLTLHWNGTTWQEVSSPSPGTGNQKYGAANELAGVAALSASNAWSVGDYKTSTGQLALTLHWNGTKWVKAASPGGPETSMGGVSMISPSDGWAVGQDNSTGTVVILHWNGTAWSQS